MTVSVTLSFWRRLSDDERPRSLRDKYEALKVRPRTTGNGPAYPLSAPPPEFRRQSDDLEIREVPEGIAQEAVQAFVQACHDEARGFALEWSPSASFVRWPNLLGIARQKGIRPPVSPPRPAREGRAG